MCSYLISRSEGHLTEGAGVDSDVRGGGVREYSIGHCVRQVVMDTLLLKGGGAITQ